MFFPYAYVFYLLFRLNPDNPRDGDRTGNCKPGTVIDTVIVAKHEFDFCEFLLIYIAYY